ncbi:MAG: DNA replication/repair protein RecF [Nocardioides sp.]
MYIEHLVLHDFRSYAEVDVRLSAGPTAFLGRNGQGKTNLIEAIDYLSRLSSHRVANDAPLVRAGAERAVVQAAVVRDGRTATLEVEIHPGRANRAKVNRSPLPRTRDLMGLVRTVVFAPEDLALVKGDPSERRRFLDDLLVVRAPRLAGVRTDYERVLKQRNSLLRSHRVARRSDGGGLATLEVWNAHLASSGAELIHERMRLVESLRPHVQAAYLDVAKGAGREHADISYRTATLRSDGETTAENQPAGAVPDRAELTEAILARLAERRTDELDRGLTLVGPHRDELWCTLSDATLELPVKGYASHGESWSFALGLRLAAYDLQRAEGDDPILVLDDVFAELDAERRDRLAHRVAAAEQVLVTAAVAADVPAALEGDRFLVAGGQVSHE